MEGASDLITSRKVSCNQRQADGDPVTRQEWGREVRKENKHKLVFGK